MNTENEKKTVHDRDIFCLCFLKFNYSRLSNIQQIEFNFNPKYYIQRRASKQNPKKHKRKKNIERI
jgi:hypothetical protein